MTTDVFSIGLLMKRKESRNTSNSSRGRELPAKSKTLLHRILKQLFRLGFCVALSWYPIFKEETLPSDTQGILTLINTLSDTERDELLLLLRRGSIMGVTGGR